MAGRWSRAWPQLRAALLAAHVVAVLVLSLPSSHKLGNRARWQDQRTQSQLALWSSRLREAGFEISREDLEARLWDLAQGYLAVRYALAWPFQPYAEVAPQGWGMFKAPVFAPITLAVDVMDGAPPRYRAVYLGGSAEHDHFAELLDHNRFRKQVGRAGYDAAVFEALSRWLARRAFRDFPEAERVRVRRVQITSLPPERRRAGETPPRRTIASRRYSRGQLD